MKFSILTFFLVKLLKVILFGSSMHFSLKDFKLKSFIQSFNRTSLKKSRYSLLVY